MECVYVPRPLASYYLASFFEARGETRLDLNSLRYIFRGPRYWIPPDNSTLNHLGAGGRWIGKGPLISRWVSTGSWIMQGPAKGWSSRDACVDVTLLGLSVNRIPPLGKRLFETFQNNRPTNYQFPSLIAYFGCIDFSYMKISYFLMIYI